MSAAKVQVERMLALVPYLRDRDGAPIEQVAADFGVSTAQILADLKVMWFCGLPGAMPGDLIEVDMDSVEGEGVVHIDNADFLDRPLRLATHEALALIVALRALHDVAGPAEVAAIARVVAKLESAAGDALAATDQVDVLSDLGGGGGPGDDRVLRTVRRGLDERRRLRIDYLVPARDESTRRDVDPLRLVVAEGRRYLEAWCYRARGQRLFRLDRISAAQVLDTPASPPAEARPRDLSGGAFQASPDQLLATLDLLPEASWVPDYYPHESVEERPDGTLRMTLRVGDPAWLRRLVMRLCGAARVVAPTELAEQVRVEAARALAAYTR
jgi:proteasome accessory factor C